MDLIDHVNETAGKIKADYQRSLFLDSNTWDAEWNPDSLGGIMHLGLVNQRQKQAGTLVAPQLMIAAAHYRPPSTGGRIYTSFKPNEYGEKSLHSPDQIRKAGDGEGYRITDYHVIKDIRGRDTDVLLCKLSVRMDWQGTPYPILAYPQTGRQIQCIVFDHQQKAFCGVVHQAESIYLFRHLDEPLVGGDSGHPSFAVYEKAGKRYPALLGCHHTNRSQPNLGYYQHQIVNQCQAWKIQPPNFIRAITDIHPSVPPPATEKLPDWLTTDGSSISIDVAKAKESGFEDIRLEGLC